MAPRMGKTLRTDFALYLITDRQQTAGRPLVDVIQAALDGGVRAIQLREKNLPDDELLTLAGQLRFLTTKYGAHLVISRRLDICRAVAADGVHLGADGPAVVEARQTLGENALIGYSAHSLDEALRVQRDGADFITFSPVFYTPSKAPYGEPQGTDKLKSVCAALTIPVLALGGITFENTISVMAAGASGVALISAIMAHADPRLSAKTLRHMIEQHEKRS